MRVAIFFLAIVAAAPAGVLSRDWTDGKLTLKLDDGAAELEWISPVAFRFERSWTGSAADALPKISHERITPELEDAGGLLKTRTRYMTVELDRKSLDLRVSAGADAVASLSLAKSASGVEIHVSPLEKVFGLMGGAGPGLDLSKERLERRNGFFFSTHGYGVLLRAPAQCVFDMTSGLVQATGARSMEFVFYYGPTPKEILEQHLTVTGATEVMERSLGLLSEERLPGQATILPKTAIDSWDALARLVRTLNQWSLSAVLYPAFDLAMLDHAGGEIKRRAADLAAMLPIVFSSSGEAGVSADTREAWKPYLITYLQEAHDRGYPLVRPLVMQFSKDKDKASDLQADVFMLGDEILLAPVLHAGGRRNIELPRGLWTDLRTNTEYRGNQAVELETPVGRVPMLARNGSLFPLAAKDAMELHYFPSLGGEFFLWEPTASDNSQFHAAPAGEFMRIEIETQVRRTYEWVLHHTKSPRDVSEDAMMYQQVAARDLLKPGTWWHDARRNDVHLVVRAEAGSDRIVNLSF